MADPKKVWTNADLKTSGPTTTYGPWKTTAKGQAQQRAMGPMPDVNPGDAIMREAKAVIARLRKGDNEHLAEMSARPTREEEWLRGEDTLGEQHARYPGRTLKEASMAGALPLSFAALGGAPALGMAAGGVLSLSDLSNAIEDPSAINVGSTAIGALPFVGPAKRALTGAKAVAPGLSRSRYLSQVARRTKPSQGGYLADSAETAMPIRRPSAPAAPKPPMTNRSGTSMSPAASAPVTDSMSEFSMAIERARPPAPPAEAATTGTGWFPQSLRGFDEATVDARMAARNAPRRPEPTIELVDDVGGLNGSGESAASLEALSRQSGMQTRGEQFVVYDRAGNARPLIGPDAVDYVPRTGETYGVQGPEGFRTLADMGGKVKGRPPASAIHPADTSGAEFGFEELPEISEGELSRLQELFKRMGI
jgi:hypothetical protein